jgi:hypothetical protein
MSAGEPTTPTDPDRRPTTAVALRLLASLVVLAAGIAAVVIAVLLVHTVLSA